MKEQTRWKFLFWFTYWLICSWAILGSTCCLRTSHNPLSTLTVLIAGPGDWHYICKSFACTGAPEVFPYVRLPMYLTLQGIFTKHRGKRQNRIIGWSGLEGTIKIICFQNIRRSCFDILFLFYLQGKKSERWKTSLISLASQCWGSCWPLSDVRLPETGHTFSICFLL